MFFVGHILRAHCENIRDAVVYLRRTDTDDVELETTLEKLLLDLSRDAVETDVALGEDRRGRLGVDRGHCDVRARVCGPMRSE